MIRSDIPRVARALACAIDDDNHEPLVDMLGKEAAHALIDAAHEVRRWCQRQHSCKPISARTIVRKLWEAANR